MKKITLLSLAVLLSGLAYAQKSITVSAAVSSAFAQKFPDAKDVKWSKENATEFESEFTSAGIKLAANFSSAGKWVVTETSLKETELPALVLSAITKNFPGYKPVEMEKVETPKTALIYEIKVEKGELAYIVQLTPSGRVLKKEKAKEEKD